MVLPGFIETHMHLMMYGMDKMKLQLDGVKSIEEIRVDKKIDGI